MIPQQANRLANPLDQYQQHINRRHFSDDLYGIGTAALASLLQLDGFADDHEKTQAPAVWRPSVFAHF